MSRLSQFATLVMAAHALNAQLSVPEPPLTFEVASVKLAAPRGRGGGGRVQTLPGGRLSATNVQLRRIVARAYDIKNFQLIGDAAELDASYDIQAVAPGGSFTDKEISTMLQNLLVERFQLQTHRASKSMSAYNLGIARGGIKFHESGDASGQTFISFRTGAITGTRSSLDALCSGISVLLGRTVFNETGLTGSYDFELHFDPNTTQSPSDPSQNSLDPSIFTAFQEQMGLKLEAKTRQVDVLVVDHVERPSSN
jgi:uncharacterized protein (TIGR03435 family)